MSKLTNVGRAKKQYEADAETITLCFQAHAENAATANEKVLAECETFLEVLTNWGIAMDQIHMSDDRISQSYDDQELEAEAAREIKLELPYSMEFNNSILALIQEKHLNVDFEIDYHLSNYESIHQELMQAALADSKAQAEMIAASMGQRIIGIDKLEVDRFGIGEYLRCEQERGFASPEKRAVMLSDQLVAPLQEESERMEVVWIMSA